jgi:mannose-6-phosphate isomerase-like protein (cupin superfamily)
MKELEPNIPPSLYKNIKHYPAEIVYELTTERTGLPFGIAVAHIEQSEWHYHKKTIETYTVVQGELEVRLGSEHHVLHPGDVIRIPAGVLHCARSLRDTPARITVTCIPEFSKTDNFPPE